MKDKPKDKPYCGVDKEKIKKASPILNQESKEIWFKWITERYNIHLKKDVEKLNKPWTDYTPLRDYKFTNVRREHDRETKWLIKNIAENKKLSYENKLLNVALFRLYNKSKTSEIFGGTIDFFKIDKKFLEDLELKLKEKAKKESLYTNAFFVSGLTRSVKQYLGKDQFTNPVRLVLKERDIFLKNVKTATNQKEVFEGIINSLFGVGQFLGYQIFVDMTYIKEFPFSENHFTVAGPGCVSGLNLLFEDRDGLNYDECLFWLRDNQEKILGPLGFNAKKLFRDLPEWDRRMNIQSIENQNCELSKFIKLVKGTGRPKVKYDGIGKTQSKMKLS